MRYINPVRPAPVPRLLSLSVALACAAMGLVPAFAQSPPATLREVVVSASRSEQFGDDLPLTVTVRAADDLEREQITDIRDAARGEPNVSVRHAPTRFALTGPANNTGREGNAGFNIRGLAGNRVLMLVDGIRVPRSYVYAGNAFGRDYLALDQIQRIEIVKGPASALYGSDGLGGLVNFITWTPADVLRTPGGEERSFGGRAAAAWSGDSQRFGLGATIAGRVSSSLAWLLAVNGARGHGLDNRGTNDVPNLDRTTPNPQSGHDTAALGKLVWHQGADRQVWTLEHVGRRTDVNLLSSRARLPLTGTAAQVASAVLDERARGTMARDRLTWEGRFRVDAPLADTLQAVVGVQRAASWQYGTSDLNIQADRVREVTYGEHTWQAGLQADRVVQLGGGWARKLTVGVDLVRSDIRNLYTGVTPLPPEVFPLKRFPDTRESSGALYAQAEWLSDRWSLVPGLRWDRFDLDVRRQDGFYPPARLPGRSLSGSALSPKVGVLFRADAAWSLFGNLAGGFRAPGANQVNAYFENAAEHVLIVPNPDLRPEKSRSLELGLRGRTPDLQLDLAVFSGRYTNLITDNVLVGGSGTANDPKRFQTLNTDRARIRGAEIKGRYRLGVVAGGELALPFAWGRAIGTNRTTGQPLNSIDPAQWGLGLAWRDAAWDWRLDLQHHAAKLAAEIDSAGLVKAPATQFAVPAATTVDLSGQWRIRRGLRLTVAVGNLTNRTWWRWADVQGLSAASATTTAYTQPGRHLRVTLSAEF